MDVRSLPQLHPFNTFIELHPKENPKFGEFRAIRGMNWDSWTSKKER